MRQLGRLGVWYPVDRLDGARIRRLLRTVEDLGYSTLWYPEALGYESLSVAGFMLANTTRLIIGSSIANIWMRKFSSVPESLSVELSGPGGCPLRRRVMPRKALYLIASASQAKAAIC